MKLTDWFPAKIRPVRVGVYKVSTPNNTNNKFCYFSGKDWCLCAMTIFDAEFSTDDSIADYSSMSIEGSMWRGIAE